MGWQYENNVIFSQYCPMTSKRFIVTCVSQYVYSSITSCLLLCVDNFTFKRLYPNHSLHWKFNFFPSCDWLWSCTEFSTDQMCFWYLVCL